MTAQEEIFGPGGGASDSTMLRVLDELGGRLRADGLPGRRLARATTGVRARARVAIVVRHGQLPAVKVAGKNLTRPATEPGGTPRPVLVVRLDATLIEAASPKAQAAGTYKQGFGFHPLTAWCSNIGDSLAVMLRPGNAGPSPPATTSRSWTPRSPRSPPPGAPMCWSASTARAPPTRSSTI
jgi:hypothetical protein